jgi:hypothetical protein
MTTYTPPAATALWNEYAETTPAISFVAWLDQELDTAWNAGRDQRIIDIRVAGLFHKA